MACAHSAPIFISCSPKSSEPDFPYAHVQHGKEKRKQHENILYKNSHKFSFVSISMARCSVFTFDSWTRWNELIPKNTIKKNIIEMAWRFCACAFYIMECYENKIKQNTKEWSKDVKGNFNFLFHFARALKQCQGETVWMYFSFLFFSTLFLPCFLLWKALQVSISWSVLRSQMFFIWNVMKTHIPCQSKFFEWTVMTLSISAEYLFQTLLFAVSKEILCNSSSSSIINEMNPLSFLLSVFNELVGSPSNLIKVR